MRSFAVERTSRKRRRCTANAVYGCLGFIEPGDRYVAASLPPNDELGNDTWWHMTECSACARYYDTPRSEESR